VGKWLELFEKLTCERLPDDTWDTYDTSKETVGFRARHPSDTYATHEGVARSEAPPPVNGTSLPSIQSSISVPEPDACVGVERLVFCDFETRNVGGRDLTKAGAWRYAVDPATEILCFGYRVDGVDNSWSPTSPSRNPLERLAANPDMTFVSFGGFEPVIWSKIMVERHGFPPIPIGRWLDLRATCASFALPRALDKALAAMGLPVEKDKEGQRLVRSLSRPNRKTGAYPELTPAIDERVAAYNRIDILALESMRMQGLGRLDAAEQAVWLLDQTINARGIAIDVAFVEAAKGIADQVMDEAIDEFAFLTGGLLPAQVGKIRDWLRDQHCALPDLESETIEEALEAGGLPDDVRRVLEIRQITAAVSLKKLNAMLAVVDADGRARGLLQYHGATTGRWSGQLIQPQNLPRPTFEAEVNPEELAAAVRSGDPERLRPWGKPVNVLVSSLRCALTAADGAMFGAGDFSMIEACVLLALAGQKDKCKLIAEGVDIYRDMAASIYGFDRVAFMGVPEEDLSPEQSEQRRIGKNGVLSSGYGIGAEGFYRRFCRHVEDGKTLATKIIGVYRNQWAPAVPKLWRDLERAARQAMLRPNATVTARCGVTYRLTTQAGLPCLVCTLLNGKQLHYANARLDGEDKFGRPRWKYNAYKQGQWSEYEPWGGQLTENVVSALARELLVDRMFALEAAGYPIVFTVHDEIVVERAGVAKEDIERIMSGRPAWAVELGVPVRVKAWVGRRYLKPGNAPKPAQEAHTSPPAAPQRVVETAAPTRVKRPPLSLSMALQTGKRSLVELFAGSGAAGLGFGSTNWSVALANDSNPVKAAAFRRNFPDVPFVRSDVAKLTPDHFPREPVDCLWMSPPCQDLSQGGTRVGLGGERSGAFWLAWSKVEALVAEGRAPKAIVHENVPGSKNQRPDEEKAAVDVVRGAFEADGYGCATFEIDAALFLPQSRRRVFVVGAFGMSNAEVQAVVDGALAALPKQRAVELNDILDSSSGFGEMEQDEVARRLEMTNDSGRAKLAEARARSVATGRPVTGLFSYRGGRPIRDANGKVIGRGSLTEPRFDGVASALRVAKTGGSSKQFVIVVDGSNTRMRVLDPREAARLMGLPDSYVLPTDPLGALSIAGDAVVVDVVRFIAEHIVEPLQAKAWVGKRYRK
jgi:DNA polymerase bacteriophage-type